MTFILRFPLAGLGGKASLLIGSYQFYPKFKSDVLLKLGIAMLVRLQSAAWSLGVATTSRCTRDSGQDTLLHHIWIYIRTKLTSFHAPMHELEFASLIHQLQEL